MRFAHRRIGDNDTELGIKRTPRSEWAKSIEDQVRTLCPLPISYDVDCTQGLRFNEFTYTEFLGGLFISTQNVEINCRIRQQAAEELSSENHLPQIEALAIDKYELTPIQTDGMPEHVGFMVGHNMFDLVSSEVVARIAFENKGFMMKLHPLTNDEYAGRVAAFTGWDRIVRPDLSGVSLLDACKVAYVTTATEFCALAVVKGKEIVNISNFFNEAGGAYYSINTLLFKTKTPEVVLNNIIDCNYSGVIFPWMDNIEERIVAFYENALKMRDQCSPLASPNNLKKIPN